MKRIINNIVLHCTGTNPAATVESIERYWRDTLQWKNPGYHYIIDRDGLIYELADPEKITNGVAGQNQNSLHISYIGGMLNGISSDTRTPRQISSLLVLVTKFKHLYPKSRVLGHRDFPGVIKDCPCFDVATWLAGCGIRY